MHASNIMSITNALIKGYSAEYDKFLDERRTEWSEKVEKSLRKDPLDDSIYGKSEETKERLRIFRGIVAENEKYCRRDIIIPDLEYESQLEKIELYKKIRIEKHGIKEKYPGILEAEAFLYMLILDYKKAFDKLSEAIKLTEEYPELIAKRDIVRYMGMQVRCLYMSNDYDKSIDKAEDTRRVASEIDISDEQEYKRHCAMPSTTLIPAAVHAFFVACDANVHHKDWGNNEKLKKGFTGLWNDSVTKYMVPKCWTTPMKIAVTSDYIWVSRVESYVNEIAEQLYVELAPNAAYKIARRIRANYNFDISYAKSAAAAVIFLTYMSAADVQKIHSPFEVKEMTTTYLMEHAKDFDPGAIKDKDRIIDSILSENGHLNPSKMLQDQINESGFALLGEQNLICSVSCSSGSEGSILRV